MILGINPYLVLDGSGQEAVQFYKEAFRCKSRSHANFW